MKTNEEISPIMIFAGTHWETESLKTQLENAGIKAVLQRESNDELEPWITAPGGVGSVKVFVSSSDAKIASEVVADFKKNANKKSE